MTQFFSLTRRRSICLGLGALASLSTAAVGKARLFDPEVTALSNSKQDLSVAGGAALKKKAAARGLIYGASARYNQLTSDPAFVTRFVQPTLRPLKCHKENKRG
jgi:endo-1,4-beta-xylanase